MTRAYVHIFSKLQHIDFLYGVHSDGYPSRVASALQHFDGDIEALEYEIYMSVTVAGNFDYYYEVDCDAATLLYGQSQIYWRNAPPDWRERGWNCWRGGKNKTYGWSEWRKGRKLDTLSISSKPISVKIIPNDRYTVEDIKAYVANDLPGSWSLRKLLRASKDPNAVHTFIRGDSNIYSHLYGISFEDIPLHINTAFSDSIRNVYKWRLNLGK